MRLRRNTLLIMKTLESSEAYVPHGSWSTSVQCPAGANIYFGPANNFGASCAKACMQLGVSAANISSPRRASISCFSDLDRIIHDLRMLAD